jgi:ADP-ribose pyrophosphatase YjhB (NUDIX family)
MAENKKFNVRVYGLLIWENKVLVTDEWLGGMPVTKFPGGGLEWGEGIADCLKREFIEEIGLVVEPGELFYINDFFQPSAFHPDHQVISIYYLVDTGQPAGIHTRKKPFDFDRKEHGEIVVRWIPIGQLNPEDFHFPIDKTVAALLVKRT